MADPVTSLNLRVERQLNLVADEVSALTAVVRPILEGVLYALKNDLVVQAGGHDKVTLEMLARLYRPGDGDCGICFEYAVHDAMNRQEPSVLERVTEAMRDYCNVPGQVQSSILFGAEKTGALRLIETARERLTEESRLLAGVRGQPVKLRGHINRVAAAFRRPDVREQLPQSISGLWKADLFLGFTDTDKWVGTSVKVNEDHLELAKGLRIGIVPTRQGRRDAIRRDEERNLVVCPLPHDGAFVETFYQGWGIVRQFIAADARVPAEAYLPRPPEREVARSLETRRTFPVVEVIDALRHLAQPELLVTSTQQADVVQRGEGESVTDTVVAPMALSTK